MPYLSIETNKKIEDNKKDQILQEATNLVSSLLNKPKKWIMISIKDNLSMYYNDSSEGIAYIELKSINLDKEKCKNYIDKLSLFIEDNINVNPDRIYIHFHDLNSKMFGWDRKLFA